MKQIRELQKELIKAACEAIGHKQDYRFRPWAKSVDKVDLSKTNGYAFEGDFINEGTIEIEVKPQVFLVMTSSGSRKYQVKHYNAVIMNAEGQLKATDVHTTDGSRGWALRIRDKVAKLVSDLREAPGPESTREELLTTLRGRLPAFTDDEIVITALCAYEIQTQEDNAQN